MPRLLLAYLALVGLSLSLMVHIASLSGIDVAASFPFVWSLHVGIFVVFIPFVFLSRKEFSARPSFQQIRAGFPGWVVAAGLVLFAYAIANFLLFMAATEGGNPSIRDGKFVLLQHGHLIREITSSEYRSFKVNELRGFSGHWLVFYFLPFAYFMFHKTKEGRA